MRRYLVGAGCAVLLTVGLMAGACGGGESSSPSSPTPSAPAPTVTAITPTSGGSAGGTAVTITGTNFGPGATVTIGGVAATAVTFVSSTSVTATTGAGAPGTVDVVYATVGGQSGRLAGGFTYLAPVDATMTFTVYNHTAGRLGAFTRTARSGDEVTLQIANLGAQPAINVSGVDPHRIVVREAAQGGRIGNFVAFSKDGQVTFKAPYQTGAAYDVFLMNGRTADRYYRMIEDAAINTNNKAVVNPKRASTLYRQDRGSATGPNEPLDNAVAEINRVLNPAWMSYGTINRSSGGGDVLFEYSDFAGVTGCAYLSWQPPAVSIFPANCPVVAPTVPFWWIFLEDLFQVMTWTYHFNADWNPPYSNATFVVEGPEPGRLSSIGRDLFAYVYVKDPKGW